MQEEVKWASVLPPATPFLLKMLVGQFCTVELSNKEEMRKTVFYFKINREGEKI